MCGTGVLGVLSVLGVVGAVVRVGVGVGGYFSVSGGDGTWVVVC